jgi:hypothetical protein
VQILIFTHLFCVFTYFYAPFARFFSTKSTLADGKNHRQWRKSLRDEIRLRREMEAGSIKKETTVSFLFLALKIVKIFLGNGKPGGDALFPVFTR